jgi:hypothetical protein
MKALDFLVGHWEGSGWIDMGPRGRQTFSGTESVESKLGGLALLVEGVHRGTPPGSTHEVVVHHAPGVLSADESGRGFRFDTWLANAQSATYTAHLANGALVWGGPGPRGGEVRFTIRLDDTGRWQESGEASSDGKNWQPFFAMTLEKQR